MNEMKDESVAEVVQKVIMEDGGKDFRHIIYDHGGELCRESKGIHGLERVYIFEDESRLVARTGNTSFDFSVAFEVEE